MGWHGVSQAMILDFTLSKQIPRYSDPALNAANPIRNEELLEGLAQMRQDREARRPSDPANTGPGGLGSPRQGDSGWGSRARGANQGDVGNNAGGAAGAMKRGDSGHPVTAAVNADSLVVCQYDNWVDDLR